MDIHNSQAIEFGGRVPLPFPRSQQGRSEGDGAGGWSPWVLGCFQTETYVAYVNLSRSPFFFFTWNDVYLSAICATQIWVLRSILHSTAFFRGFSAVDAGTLCRKTHPKVMSSPGFTMPAELASF